MERVIAAAAAVVFLFVAGIAVMAGMGIVAEGLNELHRWEEWGGQDDRKGGGSVRNFRLSDESGHQEAIIEWCAWNMQQYPELELLYHVPNGGKRDKATAAVLKRQGVKAGVPDLVLPVARCGYHGLYIELKAPGGSVQKSQKEYIIEFTNL